MALKAIIQKAFLVKMNHFKAVGKVKNEIATITLAKNNGF